MRAEVSEARPRGVIVAYSTIETSLRGQPYELEAELETASTACTIAQELTGSGIPAEARAIQGLADLDRLAEEVDPGRTVVFNLCEQLEGDTQRDAEAAQRLSDLGFTYTGAPPATLASCLDKSRTKATLLAAGIPVAAHQVFRHAGELIRVPLPALVKPVAEDASIGIDRESVVHDEPALRRRVEQILDLYHEPALAEEFIDGREFHVGLWGNGRLHTLPLTEIDYREWVDPYRRFLHFDAKWNTESVEFQTMPVTCPAEVDEDLSRRLRVVARRTYRLMRCRDYARVDLRLKNGEPLVLEVNPNPCLEPDGGFARAAEVAGYDYPAMLARIVRWARQRRRVESRAALATQLV